MSKFNFLIHKRKIIIIALSLITIAAVSVSVWAIWFRKDPVPTTPDYAPQKVEDNAKPIEEDDTTKLEQATGGGAVSLTYSKEVSLTLSNKQMDLMFQNPSKSNQDMKLEIVIDEKVIAESGRLEPGFKIDKLSDVNVEKLSAGKYNAKFVVTFYDAVSHEKAIVNTQIPIIITVNE